MVCKRGGALVETALLLPLLVFLMMVIAQIGVMVNLKLVVCEAAREAAREYATFAEDADSLCDVGKEKAVEKYKLITSDIPYGEDFQISIQPRQNKNDVMVEVCCWCKTFIPKVGHNADGHDGAGFMLCGKAVFLQELRDVAQ